MEGDADEAEEPPSGGENPEEFNNLEDSEESDAGGEVKRPPASNLEGLQMDSDESDLSKCEQLRGVADGLGGVRFEQLRGVADGLRGVRFEHLGGVSNELRGVRFRGLRL